MNYIEKVQHIIDRKKNEELTDKYYIDVSPEKKCWQSNELEKIVKDYSYIPQTYIKFIKEFDNLGLSFVTFYGSKGLKGLVLADEINEFKEYLGDKYFPFAKHADGSVYVFDRDGKVKMFDIKDYEFEEEPEHKANNFVEFIDCYVLGKNHEYNLDPDNSFGQFLRYVGWIE